MILEKIVVGNNYTNCYVIGEEKGTGAIIDPGADPKKIMKVINKLQLETITNIIITHGHFDHVLAAFELQMAFNIPFIIHPKDKKLLSRATDSASYWMKREIVVQPPKVNQEINQRDKIKLGEFKLEVLETPGHTPGGTALYNQDKKIAFVGDTIFKDGVGRTDFK